MDNHTENTLPDYSLFLIMWVIHLQVTITDANDNCPEISPTSATLTPVPVLTTNASVTFTSVDADSGENANVRYVLTDITEV